METKQLALALLDRLCKCDRTGVEAIGTVPKSGCIILYVPEKSAWILHLK